MPNECVVCGGKDAKPFYPGLLKCVGCGHVFADVCLTEDAISKLYGRAYFFGDEYIDYIGDKKILQKNFALRFHVLKTFLSPDQHKHLLEVGCAYGFFLDIARDQFETVQGIDINEDAITYARQHLGIAAECGDLLKHDLGEKSFDLVCMWDTIEHTQWPNLYLEKLAKNMKKGSLIAITTGDIESLTARIRKEKWRLIHPPTHIHYFSMKTLETLLNRNGFEVIYNRYCGFYRSLDFTAYRILVLSKLSPGLYTYLSKWGLAQASFYLNLYDIMYVIAKKKI